MDVDGQLYTPATLPRAGRVPGTPCLGVWVVLRAGLEAAAKTKNFYRESNPGRSAHNLASILKGKVSPCLTEHHAIKTYWGSGGISPAFLTSSLGGGEWSASRPGRFTPTERAPCTHWIEGWVGPRAVLDAVVKRKIPSPRLTTNPELVEWLMFIKILTQIQDWNFLVGSIVWMKIYESISKSFRTVRLERELKLIQFSATRCSFIAILLVSIVSFAAITLCVPSQRVFIVVYSVIDSVRKLLDIPL
jgi:hypothetical protein